MQLRITTLSENTAAKRGVLAEQGLSVLVNTGNLNSLMENGASISVAHNAYILGIDLANVHKIVLGHRHYDNSGGLQEVLTKTGEVVADHDVWAPNMCVASSTSVMLGPPFRSRNWRP